jgi:hypothetical protein
MIVLLRNIYDVTKPSSKVNLTTPTMPIATNTQQSEGDVDPEHIRYMRAKKAKDLKEAAAYTKVLATRAAEERSQQRSYSNTGHIYFVGPRGGLYYIDASGNRRYVTPGLSNSGGSRRRSRRR